MSFFGGPLTSLFFLSFLPCCQKEEDKNAAEALAQINKVGARIVWHRDNRTRLENVKAAFSGFLSPGKKNSSNADSTRYGMVKAHFKLFDNEDGIPEIQIAPRTEMGPPGALDGSSDNESAAEDNMELDFVMKEKTKKKKIKEKKNEKQQQLNILLKRIYTVVPTSDQDLIILNTLEGDGHNTREFARFALEGQDQGTRNNFVMNLQLLMEWDRNRRSSCGELEWDETSDAVTLRSRAQKTAHLAQREMEMKRIKKSREEKKAKYVEQAGGLKYTALAMARNATGSTLT